MHTQFILTAITSDPQVVRAASAAGVDRIGIDIEHLGKAARQGHIPGARISAHQLEDLRAVTANIHNAEVFARLNPLHPGSRDEVETAIALGARALMLPQFKTACQAEAFVNLIMGRAAALLLLETTSALDNLPAITAVAGVSEIMVGLNDLHLALGLSSHFELVVSDVLARISHTVSNAGIRFGFGGVARFDDDALPVPADLVLAQYLRLQATSAWLSRSFFRGLPLHQIVPAVHALRHRLDYWRLQSPASLARTKDEIQGILALHA
jgi:2-keto-3-deoxy-L-rhamnonate aldolase RhmA